MPDYVIYEVKKHGFGVKIGCTKHLKQRCDENRRALGHDVDIAVLETLVNATVHDAAVAERRWAARLGYGKRWVTWPYEGSTVGAASPHHHSKQPGFKAVFDAGRRLGLAASLISPRNVARQLVVCPHCQREGTLLIMSRWHLDRCRKKPITP